MANQKISQLDPAETLDGVQYSGIQDGDNVRVPQTLFDAKFQPLDADLSSIAALTTTSFGRGLLTEVSATTARTTLGAFETLADAEAEEIADDITTVTLLGRAAAGDHHAALYKEVTDSGDVLAGQFVSNPGVNQRRWENAEDTITPAMFENIEEMFEFTRAQIQMPAGNYEFDAPIAMRAGAVVRAEEGAILIPTFEPTGADRATPLITCGAGVDINYLHLQLDAGIDTIRIGMEVGDNSQIGLFKAVSSDLNNNRTEAGSTDLISGALLLRGEHIRVGQTFINRFDAPMAFIDCKNVIVGKVRHEEVVRGIYGHGSRDVHILAGFTTGPTDPTEPNGFVNGRGVMTPGANSLLLAGVSDSSFGAGGGWWSYDILEHAIRVGQIASGTSVPNHRLAFHNVQSYRPYGCGFKMDDGDNFNIKRVLIDGLYTEDVGRGNWFGEVGYTNWSSGSVDNPASDNDGNKAACAIRNSQYVRLLGFQNRTETYDESGYFGLWIERSNNVLGVGIDTEKSREDGVVIQSGGSVSPERIELQGVATRENGASGLLYRADPSNANWRGVVVTGLDSQNNTGYGYEVTSRLDGDSPFATLASRIEGFTRGNTAGNRSLTANVAADTDFSDAVEEEGTFTPTFTFTTPGDLALTSVSASGIWKRRGNIVSIEGSYSATVTHTTASGNLRVGGLPFVAASSTGSIDIQSIGVMVDWNSRTMLRLNPVSPNDFMELRGYSPSGGSPLGAADITTGETFLISFAGTYRI